MNIVTQMLLMASYSAKLYVKSNWAYEKNDIEQAIQALGTFTTSPI